MEKVKNHTACRICSGPLTDVINYGALPLANALADTKEEALNAERFEQKLLFCPVCLLGQLSVVVAPEILYKDYVYQSSVSETFRTHCAGLAAQLNRMYPESCVIIDIAGNDGCLAREIAKARPGKDSTFVVDPAQNGEPENYTKIKQFWNTKTADGIKAMLGEADIVTAQNVAGHVDDVLSFFHSVRSIIRPGGSFVVEVPSFLKLIETCAFDTVYHEHVSYWTVSAMTKLADLTGFELVHVQDFPVHCGSLRFWFMPVDEEVMHGGHEHREKEAEFFTEEVFAEFGKRVVDKTATVRTLLMSFASVAGITASAKSAVMLNMVRNISGMSHLVDSAPSKHGKFSPGTGLEIKPFTPENIKDAYWVLIFSRNLAGPLTEELTEYGFKGLVITV